MVLNHSKITKTVNPYCVQYNYTTIKLPASKDFLSLLWFNIIHYTFTIDPYSN